MTKKQINTLLKVQKIKNENLKKKLEKIQMPNWNYNEEEEK